MAGKDMPSLEVRAGRGGRPPLSSRDRELGRDGSPGAILDKAPPAPAGGAFVLGLNRLPGGMYQGGCFMRPGRGGASMLWDLRVAARADKRCFRS